MKETAVEYIDSILLAAIEKFNSKEYLIAKNTLKNFRNVMMPEAREMEKKEKLTRQLFIGKVAEIIGFEKTVELLKESEKTINQ
jgi:hypothetical protein